MLLSVTGLAWLYGGPVERRFTIGLIGASLATLACLMIGDWATARVAYFIIDCAIFVMALWVALSHDRYWPIWFAGFLFIVILADIASVVAPAPNANLYGNLGSFWAIPALLVFAIGLALDSSNRKTVE